ncbi:MAG TPA: hypothetical protein VMU95_38840 [Trebonia sp.]|nr:hypothetical protein [Trebonia sp.]
MWLARAIAEASSSGSFRWAAMYWVTWRNNGAGDAAASVCDRSTSPVPNRSMRLRASRAPT